jgi:serine/threonine protein kinase
MDIDHRQDKVKQMERELNISAKLKHANIVNLLDVIFDQGRAMLVMEMANGGQLFDLVANGKLPEDRARHFFAQMVSAMEYCHTEKIYHRVNALRRRPAHLAIPPVCAASCTA